MNILFVCKYNRFRSKVAEAFFNRYNKRKNVQTQSAGILVDEIRPFPADRVIKAMESLHAPITNIPSRKITDEMIKWADKIIIAADNVSPDYFPPEKTIVWEIKDASENNIRATKKSIESIRKKVRYFVSSLGKLRTPKAKNTKTHTSLK